MYCFLRVNITCSFHLSTLTSRAYLLLLLPVLAVAVPRLAVASLPILSPARAVLPFFGEPERDFGGEGDVLTAPSEPLLALPVEPRRCLAFTPAS